MSELEAQIIQWLLEGKPEPIQLEIEFKNKDGEELQ